MKRLREDESSSFVKALLDSAAGDAPRDGVEERALRAAEAELVVPKGWPKGWILGGTIVGIGVVLLLIGPLRVLGPSTETTTTASVASTAAPPVSIEPIATATGTPTATPPPTVTTAEPTAPPTATTTAPPKVLAPPVPSVSATTIASTAPSSTATVAAEPSHPLGLRDELAMIDEARTSLGSGNGAAALATLDRYDARFPSGLLREEAEAVRVEALFAAGRGEEGKRLGAEFLRVHPSSPHAQRVRSLLDAHGGTNR